MSSGTMKFNGYLRVRIGEAVGLQPTRWSLRHSLFKKGYQLLDPYLTVSVDQVRVGQTSTKQKTNKPTYNEEFCANVTDGGHLELAVFHETPLGYDHFVANCTLQFQELLRTAGTSDTFEGWVLFIMFMDTCWFSRSDVHTCFSMHIHYIPEVNNLHWQGSGCLGLQLAKFC
uniref:Protein kinase C eta n=1 Tax=Ovis aries TaxID=9940 RepID=A0AC11DP29_SHEEP